MTQAQLLYRQTALTEVWRLVSQIDRNPHSRTRGSFSRTHWGWKFHDFPFPRLQEGVYALARFHDLPGEDNPFFQSEAVARWIHWGFEYWTSRQHGNGSFDEAYPWEQCLAATAFTSFYLGSAFLSWRSKFSPSIQDKLISRFERAGRWLCANDETHGVLSNHLAAAAAGLQVLSTLCDHPDFSDRAHFFLERIWQNQSDEGWLREYDGADIGYGTHAFFYLAAYWKQTGCSETLARLRRFAFFLTHFIHPDGTLGGEYGSRNTELYFPAGFELLATECSSSAAIATVMRESIGSRRVCGVWAVDTFNFMPMLNNLFFAMDAASPLRSSEPLPWQSPPFERYFPHAGLWVVNRASFYAIVGLGKGGTVSVFDKGRRRLAACHGGIIGVWRGRTYCSQEYGLWPDVTWSSDHLSVSFAVRWNRVQIPVFTPILFIAFRLFTLTVGRLPAVSRWLKNRLVEVLIRKKGVAPVDHLRRVALTDEGILVEDRLRVPEGMERLQVADRFTAIHMGSSMYCDVRAAGPSAGIVEFPRRETVHLVGRLGLAGSAWREEAPHVRD